MPYDFGPGFKAALRKNEHLIAAEVTSKREPREHKDSESSEQKNIPNTVHKDVFAKSAENRVKWLQKLLPLVGNGRVSTTVLYDVVAHRRFRAGASADINAQMSELVRSNLNLFSSKQQKLLLSDADSANTGDATDPVPEEADVFAPSAFVPELTPDDTLVGRQEDSVPVVVPGREDQEELLDLSAADVFFQNIKANLKAAKSATSAKAARSKADVLAERAALEAEEEGEAPLPKSVAVAPSAPTSAKDRRKQSELVLAYDPLQELSNETNNAHLAKQTKVLNPLSLLVKSCNAIPSREGRREKEPVSLKVSNPLHRPSKDSAPVSAERGRRPSRSRSRSRGLQLEDDRSRRFVAGSQYKPGVSYVPGCSPTPERGCGTEGQRRPSSRRSRSRKPPARSQSSSGSRSRSRSPLIRRRSRSRSGSRRKIERPRSRLPSRSRRRGFDSQGPSDTTAAPGGRSGSSPGKQERRPQGPTIQTNAPVADETTIRLAQMKAASRLASVPNNGGPIRDQDWMCQFCNAHNYRTKIKCFRCGQGDRPPRPVS